jgi:hypothetical protein
MSEYKKQRRRAIKHTIAPDDHSRATDEVESLGLESTQCPDKGELHNPRSSRISPIHLDGQPVLSLDAPLDSDGRSISHMSDIVAEPEGEVSSRTIDWQPALKATRLSRLERRAIEETRKGVPGYELHKVLGCTPKVAKRALALALEKVRKVSIEHLSYPPVPHSRRLLYRERLPSAPPGRRPHSFLPLATTQVFREIMLVEKYKGLISQRDPKLFEKQRIVLYTCYRKGFKLMTVEEIEEIELAAVMPLRKWHSAEYCNAFARTRAENRIKAEREAAERDRINALTLDQIKAELVSTSNHLRLNRLRRSQIVEKLLDARTTLEHRRLSGKREVSAFQKSGIADLEEQLETIDRELGRINALRPQLLEAEKYRHGVAVRRDVEAAEERIEPELRKALYSLAKKIHGAHPLVGRLENPKLFAEERDRTILLQITRGLGQLGAMERGEARL